MVNKTTLLYLVFVFLFYFYFLVADIVSYSGGSEVNIHYIYHFLVVNSVNWESVGGL